VHASPCAAVAAALWGVNQRKPGTVFVETRRWSYPDADGRVGAMVVRFDSSDGSEKTYAPIHRVEGGWCIGDPSGAWPLYALPEISTHTGVVVVCEGEKASDAGRNIGLCCTTSAHGAKSPAKTDWTPLAGREVVILPDNDDAGRAYAESVKEIVLGLSPPAEVKIVQLPGLPDKGDLYDFCEAHDAQLPEDIRKEILALVEAAAYEEPKANSQPAGEQDSTETAARPMGDQSISAKFGDPYYKETKGGLALNEAFWAGLYSAEHITVYEPDEGEFYQYDAETGLYILKSTDCIKTEISARLLRASRESSVLALQRKRTDSNLKSIVAHLRGQVEKRQAFTDRQERYIHLATGVLQFKAEGHEADLVPFAPEFFSRNQSPIAFDENARCERFLNELVYPAVHSEDVVVLQKYFGLCLLGRNVVQRFLLLDGTPNGGKTQFVITLQKIVGMANLTQLRTEHLAERFELYRYRGKTLLVGVDVEANFLNTRGASVIKALVGGDWLDAEQKGGNGNFQIQGTFCVVITSNSRLRVRLEGDLGAWRRRLLIVRYENPPPTKRIPDFGDLLVRTEGPGILNWALCGLRMLFEDIEATGDISLSERQRERVDSLLAESESLRHFLTECVEQVEEADLTVAELVEAYAEYCPTKHWKALPITVVHSQLEGLMLELFGTTKANSIEREGRSNRGFRRVRFRQDYRPTISDQLPGMEDTHAT
jgi:phage/plasmid-associated DNA primase